MADNKPDEGKSSKPKERQTNAGGAQRRTWDLEEYEKRARERAELGDEGVEGDVDERPMRDREEFAMADAAAAGPAGSNRAFLKKRETNLGLTTAVGKTQIITDSGIRQKGGGWWCDACECLLKDSANYLDHINGKKHQRKLGFSMRVERSTCGQVSGAFENARKRKAEEESGDTGPSAIEAYEQRLMAQRAEEERRKKAKKDAKVQKKKEQEALEVEGMDPEIAAMMGFGGFGGSSKR